MKRLFSIESVALAVIVIAGAACTSSDGEATADAATDAPADVVRDPRCPNGASPGGVCSSAELGAHCDYSDRCGQPGSYASYVVVDCVGPNEAGICEWISTAMPCPTRVPTRADGCPATPIDSQPCTDSGKECAYDDHCPTFRVTEICSPRPGDGTLIWRSREDACPK